MKSSRIKDWNIYSGRVANAFLAAINARGLVFRDISSVSFQHKQTCVVPRAVRIKGRLYRLQEYFAVVSSFSPLLFINPGSLGEALCSN